MKRCSCYPSELTDAEWAILEPLLPAPAARGRPRTHELRTALDAVFYLLRGGIAWRAMPRDFPPWRTVYYHFRRWRISGLWEALNAALRQRVRRQAGREATPGAAVVDNQTVRTIEAGGPRGFDGGKRVNGRKRQVLVDTNGLLLRVKVHVVSMLDRDGARLLLEGIAALFPRLALVWAGYGWTPRSTGRSGCDCGGRSAARCGS